MASALAVCAACRLFGATMSRWIVFAGVTAMLVTGYFAAHDTRGEGLLRSVQHVPERLLPEVTAALSERGLEWAIVRMDGQRAVLSGEAPSELDRLDAIETARRAAGRGGALWGPVTSVDGAAIVVQAPRKPYQWTAQRGQGLSVRFSGAVPSQRLKREIAAEARKIFPQGVADETRVASGYPTGDWKGSVLLGLRQLKRLDAGELQFNDGVLVLVGQVADDGVRSEIKTAMDKIRRPLSGSAQLTTADLASLPPPAAVDAEEEAAPESSADCERLIAEAMRNNIILFAPGSSQINAKGLEVINAMANLARRCPALRIKVTGYGDDMSADAAAVAISRQRAFAVSQLLRQAGVGSARLIAVGENTTQPAVEGTTSQDTTSRRVEISVIP